MSSQISKTRTRILEVTLEVLEEQRGRDVRMADIAKRASVSRQAIYLHFASRTDLLTAATKFLDRRLDLDRRLAPSRSARSGTERLNAYIKFWGDYIPEIYGVAKALLLQQDTDEAAALAWKDRMSALRDGCRAAVEALQSDGVLAAVWTEGSATDFLWTLMSVTNWEHLTIECGWSNRQYIDSIQLIAQRTLIEDLKRAG